MWNNFLVKSSQTKQKRMSIFGVTWILGALLRMLSWVKPRCVPAGTGWTLCSSGSCFSHGQSVAGWTHSPSWRECGDELWSGWRCLVHSLQEGRSVRDFRGEDGLMLKSIFGVNKQSCCFYSLRASSLKISTVSAALLLKTLHFLVNVIMDSILFIWSQVLMCTACGASASIQYISDKKPPFLLLFL